MIEVELSAKYCEALVAYFPICKILQMTEINV